jgi:hypothetical protein
MSHACAGCGTLNAMPNAHSVSLAVGIASTEPSAGARGTERCALAAFFAHVASPVAGPALGRGIQVPAIVHALRQFGDDPGMDCLEA